MGPEWWWQADVHAQLLGEVLDAVRVGSAAAALPALALGAKPDAVRKALTSVEPWKRPYTPPKPQPKRLSIEEKAARLLALIGGR